MICNIDGCEKQGLHRLVAAFGGKMSGHLPTVSYCEEHFKNIRPEPAPEIIPEQQVLTNKTYDGSELEKKVAKLKSLLLLTDPINAHEQVTDLQISAWSEYLRCFPDES